MSDKESPVFVRAKMTRNNREAFYAALEAEGTNFTALVEEVARALIEKHNPNFVWEERQQGQRNDLGSNK
ncbi:MAG: hypothetical protein AAF787_00030 [Chloroflexota bacterium]